MTDRKNHLGRVCGFHPSVHGRFRPPRARKEGGSPPSRALALSPTPLPFPLSNPPTQPTSAVEAVLTTTRAAQLDHLLNQTDMYTKFLSEQMASIEEKTEAEAAAEAAAKAGGRGGRAASAGPDPKKARTTSAGGGRPTSGGKRGKAAAPSPTQVCVSQAWLVPFWRGVRRSGAAGRGGGRRAAHEAARCNARHTH